MGGDSLLTALFAALFGLTLASCHGGNLDPHDDADDDVLIDDAGDDSGQPDITGAGEGCLGGSPAFSAGVIDHVHSGLELSTADEQSQCCSEYFCCERSDGLDYVRLDPAGNGDWQIQAELKLCCIGPLSAVLMRTDASGSVKWMRTTCHSNEAGFVGTELKDAIPFAVGHLVIYRVRGSDGESTDAVIEIRFLDAEGQITWTLSPEALGNATAISSLSDRPMEKAQFILLNDQLLQDLLSVSSEGAASIVPIPDNMFVVSTAIPDIPEGSNIPVLLTKNEGTSSEYTKYFSFAVITPEGTIDGLNSVGSWEAKSSVNGFEVRDIGPDGAGFLLVVSDNKTNIWDIVHLDENGDHAWRYEVQTDSTEWPYCSRDYLELMEDGRTLVIGNRDISPTNKFPYRGTLDSNGSTLDFQILGDLEMPYADSEGWNISSIRHIGDQWLVVGNLPGANNATTGETDKVIAVYDSDFDLIHVRYLGVTGTNEDIGLAEQDGIWAMTYTLAITGAQCLADLHRDDATTTFMTFEGICE